MDRLKRCTLCPRECKVDRTKAVGFCKSTDVLKVARAELHFWEEPCISGENGSGCVFFSGCNLQCVFCQNSQISRGEWGKEITVQRLCEIFLELEKKGAHNINLVTPTHFVLHIIKALDLARERGLNLPIVYNTSGYEKVETLRLLKGYVDIYLPDFKYYDERFSKKYSNCKDYFENTTKALDEMFSQVGECEFDENGLLKKGVVIRHLCLPKLTDDTKRILKYLSRRFGESVLISIMSQYTPMGDLKGYEELSSSLSQDEYSDVLEYAQLIGISNGFSQEGESAKESFIPPFDLTGV